MGWNKQNDKYKICRFFFLLFFFFIHTLSYSQQWAFELWHPGKIVLNEGDTLRGQVKYDLQQDIVQYAQKDETVDAFSARKVLFFEIFDKTVNKYRQFYALPFNAVQPASYKTLVFFELLENGALTLLTREAVELRTSSYGFYGGTYSRQVLVHKFFFLNEKGDITEFTGNKNDLLDMLGKKSDEVEKFIRQNRLKLMRSMTLPGSLPITILFNLRF
jgi:hypothetical protein